MSSEPPRPRRPVLLVTTVAPPLVLVVVVLVAGMVASRWWPVQDAAGPVAGAGQDNAASKDAPIVVEAEPAQRTGTVHPEQPRSVRLPTGVVIPVRAVSTTADGLLDVPDDVRTAGWWRGGSRVGDPWGSTIVAAHVDSTRQGLGPFAALLAVRRSQRFTVSSATLHQTFAATSKKLIARKSLQHHPWIFSASGSRRLVLVTCAPPYLPSRGGYQNLVVVTATPVSAPAAGRR